MALVKASSPITKDKVVPRILFMGVPSVETTYLRHIFGLDGTITVRDEWFEQLGYELKINPLDFGFVGTVELYEDVEAQIVMVNYKFRWQGKDYELQAIFYFGVDYGNKVKVKIKGILPKAGNLRIPFQAVTHKLEVWKKRFWSGYLENGEVLSGVGFDWSDIAASSFDEATKTLSFSVGANFELDPSIAGTSTSSTATHAPHQRASFYAAGRHWVFYTDGLYFGWRSSLDGVTWTAFTTIASGVTLGKRYAVWFDGTYVHYVWHMETSGDAIYYRRGTPGAGGSITWSAAEQVAIPPMHDELGRDGVVAGSWTWLLYTTTFISPNVRRLDPLAMGVAENYLTEVNIGSYAATNKFVFTPYVTVTTPVTTTLPTTIQRKGWMYGDTVQRKVWFLDGRMVAVIRVKNPDAIVHAGNLYGRLWVSPNSDLSGATALTGWVGVAVSFSGAAGQIIDVTINFDMNLGVGNAFAVENKYFYLELLWDVTTAATNARVQVEAALTSKISVPAQILYFPNIVVDSAGYPWIGYRRYNGIGPYPYITKGNANDGTFSFRLSSHRKLSVVPDLTWAVTPVPLTGGKLRAIYHKSDVLSALWDGSAWTAQNPPTISLSTRYVSAINDGDDTIFAVLEYATYHIKVIKHTYGVGWDASYTTVQASTTSSSMPVMSWQETGKSKVFWAGSPTANHVYYKTITNMVPDTDPTDWIDESTEVLTGNDRLTCFYKNYGNNIGLVYMTKTAEPYNVKYAFISLVVAVPMPKFYKKGTTMIFTSG